MKAMNLTPKQNEVYNYIKGYIEKNNVSPFIREIQEGCSINCYKAAVDKLLVLEKKGFIRRELNKHRGIKVNGMKMTNDEILRHKSGSASGGE